MRAIKFRGKDLDTNEWVYGDLLRAIDYDRDYNPGRNMLWLDIEKIIPNLPEGGEK